MENTSITIELLASKIGGNLWVKGDMKRIYLDCGYNTKKMSTKTYVYESNGEFKVSCYIECPSQDYNWIKSQQEKVVNSVNESIEKAIKELSNPEKYNHYPYKQGFSVISFLSLQEQIERGLAISFTKNNQESIKKELSDILNEITITIHRDGSGNFRLKKEGEKSALEILSNIPVEKTEIKIEIKNEIINNFGVGSLVSHSKFGNGTVVLEDENKIAVNFTSVGEKMLLKKFAQLSKI